jgi:hypothetical protein
MKTNNNFVTSIILVSILALLGVFMITACHKDSDNTNNNSNMYTISGNASGSQMVPTVSGGGSANISGTYNASTNQLTYTTTWTNLSGAPTLGAFYTGATGVNGSIAGSAWTMGSGLTGTGTFSNTVTLTNDQETQLLNGNYYYILGTTANATGEVRGQITASVQ